jgi:DNA-directed RNA polymerase subunit RPC12/RpoP
MTEEWKPTHYIKDCDLFPGNDQSLIEVMVYWKSKDGGEVQVSRLGDGYVLYANVKHLIPITIKSTTALKTVYKCPKCGDRNSLLRDAYAMWVEEKQCWELFDMYDLVHCHNCDIELSFVGDLK